MASSEDTVDRLSAALADRYTIEAEIGAGGMATVYLAEDLKHHRRVALKVLRPELAAILGTERFLKEIEVTANLQHPHILPLYDSGEADSFLYYVMPHIEGESLREKLDREKQLSVEDTTEITKSVAAALDYAHQQGVVHRDIKPENILLQTGQALVADFGIAVAISQAGRTRLTETGLSLGTPHYMSPEQATADRELDARSDVYSLGAVVYEMLVGEPPHVGNSAQAIVAKILTDTPPPIARTRELIPANVDAAVCCALAKSPADRFSSAAEFAAALLNPAFTLPTLSGGAQVSASHRTRMWQRVAVGMAAVAVLFAGLALWPDPDPPRPVTRRLMAFLPGQELTQNPLHVHPVGFAPDGSWFVYVGPEGSGSQLWVQREDEYQATPLAGTEGASSPTVSPDGRSIVYTRGSMLWQIPAAGGPSETLSDSAPPQLPTGVAWLDDGTVVFIDSGYGLRRMAATGGPSEIVWSSPVNALVDPVSGRGVFTVTPLPDSRGVLFGVCNNLCEVQEVWALDFGTGESHRVLNGAFLARYAPSGHLVAQRVTIAADVSSEVFAVPFDLEALQTSGEAVGLWEDGWVKGMSDQGTLLIELSAPVLRRNEVVWVSRDGSAAPVDPSWRFNLDDNSRNYGWALSPDGSRLAIGTVNPTNFDIWIKPLDDRPASQLTFEEAFDFRPQWTPDGRSVTYISTSNGAGRDGIYRKRADGTGVAELVYSNPLVAEVTVAGNAEWIVARTGNSVGLDIVGFRPGVDSAAVPLLVEEYDEMAPALSHDNRWLAYTSTQSGESEVYVRPFPDVEGGHWAVSLEGGHSPLWAHSGQELFFISAANEMVAASVNTEPVFEVTDHRVLFQLSPDFVIDPLHTAHDISPDDQRFIMVRRVGPQEAQRQLFVIENFFEELKERVGG